jgi:hypothetical protein
MNGTVRRLPVKGADRSIELIEIDGIFYLEAQGDDTLIRTKRKKPYKSVQRLGDLAKKLPAPAFVRCHREFIVNLNRVRMITPRASRDYDLRLDPPVNRRIPIARNRLEEIRKILGVLWKGGHSMFLFSRYFSLSQPHHIFITIFIKLSGWGRPMYITPNRPYTKLRQWFKTYTDSPVARIKHPCVPLFVNTCGSRPVALGNVLKRMVWRKGRW